MRYGRQRWGVNRDTGTPVVPESALQKYLDDRLALAGIVCRRVPDWINRSLSVALRSKRWTGLLIAIRKHFAGLPDNSCLRTLSERYSLALHFEIKTEDILGRKVGSLKKDQREKSEEIPFTVARNTREIDRLIEEFEKDAHVAADLLREFGSFAGIAEAVRIQRDHRTDRPSSRSQGSHPDRASDQGRG